MESVRELREMLARQLDWEDAHVGFARAVANLPAELRGVVPDGLAHSAWELVEHTRRVQFDILDFCANPGYVEPASMDDYWPPSAAPAEGEWEASIGAYERDLAALKALALDDSVDLFAQIPHGSGQTYLRELLLAVDHAAYEVGQLVLVRRLLGCWP